LVTLEHGDKWIDCVDGDGNCFLRATARQLDGGGLLADDSGYPEVRRKLVAYASDKTRIGQLIDEFADYLPAYPRLRSSSQRFREAAWNRIVRRLATDRAWDDEAFDVLAIALLPRALQRTVRVFEPAVATSRAAYVTNAPRRSTRVVTAPRSNVHEPKDDDELAIARSLPPLDIFHSSDHYGSVRRE
jgi:hypothetical protein